MARPSNQHPSKILWKHNTCRSNKKQLEGSAANKMDNYEPNFGPRNRMLSFISEGRESEFDDDSMALDDSGRSRNNDIRASVFMRGDSMLEAVQEDDSMRDGSVFSASSRGRSVRSAASHGSRRRSNLSSSVTTSHSKSLRSSMQSTGTSYTHATMSSVSSPLVFTQHSLKQVSTREINIHETPYWTGMDESLPEEYSDASLYDHELILPPKEKEESIVSSEQECDYRMMSPEYKWSDTNLLSSQRKVYALVTVLGAITLCIVGIIVAAQVLGTNSSMSYTPNFNAEFFYLPRYEFGGGSGGITGIRDDGVRRVEDSTYYDTFTSAAASDGNAASDQYVQPSSSTPDAPKLLLASTADTNPSSVKLVANTRSSLQSLRAAQDPFGGFGPRQFNPMYDRHYKPQDKKVLTSSALSSYTPPEEEDGLTIVLDPLFNGAMIDVSVLPVNPDREMPVFWDVPMSAVSRIQYVLGHCLKLVQCTEAGKYLLIRDIPDSYDPPLKVASEQSLKYVNVDCSTPHGIARGISHNLATSKMIDAVYTPEIHDAARLFAPPMQAYGRGLVMMRHPVERICALYEYLKVNGDDSKVNGLSLQEYANSSKL